MHIGPYIHVKECQSLNQASHAFCTVSQGKYNGNTKTIRSSKFCRALCPVRDNITVTLKRLGAPSPVRDDICFICALLGLIGEPIYRP